MEYIKITLRSDLCAGNGESVGNAVDQDVCMNTAGLPYIPSRRLKGCLRQSAMELKKMGLPEAQTNIEELFGNSYGQKGCLVLQDAVIPYSDSIGIYLRSIGEDKSIPSAIKKTAHASSVKKLFSSVRGQTKLENGVKVDNTLRFTRVVSKYDPFNGDQEKNLEFYAPVYLESDKIEIQNLFEACIKATRHIGMNRNRGLGNVLIEKIDEADIVSTRRIYQHAAEQIQITSDLCKITYKIALDASVTLPGCDELNTFIPARSVIGCMAGNYLKSGTADQKFSNLFLDGTVVWSALTPVVKGVVSTPVSMNLVKLKNDENGKMINYLTEEGTGWKKLKPKTMDGAFCAVTAKDGKLCYEIVEPEIYTIYHNRINKKEDENGLYTQESIDAGLIYGGTVICPNNMKEEILQRLKQNNWRFGRSQSVQYAACSLYGEPVAENFEDKNITVAKDETIYVVLKSDLTLNKNGMYCTDNETIREAIAAKLGVEAMSSEALDNCRYHVISGYQTTWQLQKPQVPVVKAGSVYCFTSNGGEIPESFQLGAFKQEGFGVCQVITSDNEGGITEIYKGSIDRVSLEPKEDYHNQVYQKLLTVTAMEAIRRYAVDFKMPCDETGKEVKLPIGRFRRMLSDAEDYQGLKKMVMRIKESDKSSEKEMSNQELCHILLRELYENKELDQYGRSKYSGILEFGHMLNNEAGLWEEIQKHQDVIDVLKKNWKLPLGIILHVAHNKKER